MNIIVAAEVVASRWMGMKVNRDEPVVGGVASDFIELVRSGAIDRQSAAASLFVVPAPNRGYILQNIEHASSPPKRPCEAEREVLRQVGGEEGFVESFP